MTRIWRTPARQNLIIQGSKIIQKPFIFKEIENIFPNYCQSVLLRIQFEGISPFRFSINPYGPNTSEAVMNCKVSQRYLIKSSCKKKNIDWNIHKILFFAVENKCYRADSNFGAIYFAPCDSFAGTRPKRQPMQKKK